VIKHLYPHFLTDVQEYALVERFWVDLWLRIDPNTRQGWQQPWFQPLPPRISEGNPIFTAVSRERRRAVRVIQFEPTENNLEFVAYPDTFGGQFSDPSVIHELVISCALSDMAAMYAQSLMRSWVEGNGLSANVCEAGLVLSDDFVAERIYDVGLYHDIHTQFNDRLTGDEWHENNFLGRIAI
jgi:hypothetical protein